MACDNTIRNSLAAAIVVGLLSTMLAVVGWRVFEFDAALVVYAEALILSLALTAYRFSIWAHRPPTRILYRQALRMAMQPTGLLPRVVYLFARSTAYFALNRFVWKRARQRWLAHWPIAVGCVMALAIVVPLVFGWVWVETPTDDLHSYKVMVFGMHVRTIPNTITL